MRLPTTLALLLAPALLRAMPYSGSQCVGFIDFELDDGQEVQAAAAESDVQELMDGVTLPLIPMWLRQQCVTQLRRFTCLSKFIPLAATPTQMCASVCEDFIEKECYKFLSEAPQIRTAWTIFASVPTTCSTYPTTACTAGGSDYEFFPQDAAVCPTPLLKTDPLLTNYERILAPTLLDISDCNTKCPTYVYDAGEWDNMKTTVAAFVWLSLIVSVAILASLIALKKLNVLNGAFLVSCIGASFGMVVLVFSGQDRVYCEDEVYVHDRAPVCVAQGFLTIVCSIAIALTITFQAFDTFLKVILGFRGSKLKYLDYCYLAIIVIFPVICAVVALANDNIGFDTFWLIPMCFYRRTVSLYYVRYLFMFPQIIALSVCAVLVILTSVRTIRLLSRTVAAQQRNSASEESSERTSARMSAGRSVERPPFRCCRSRNAMALWRKVIQYNVQSSIFVLAYCALSAGCLLAVVTREQNFDTITHTTVSHVGCILQASARSSDTEIGIEECGSFPEDIPALSRQGFLAAFYGGPGVFAFLIYAPTLLSAVRLLVKTATNTTQHRSSQFLSSVVVTADKRQALPEWQTEGVTSDRETPPWGRGQMEMTPLPVPTSPSAAASSASNNISNSNPVEPPSSNRSGPTRSSTDFAEFSEGDTIEVGGEPIAEVVRHLGKGQFGNVYAVAAAWTSNKQLAMKCARIPKKSSADGSNAERVSRSTHEIKQFCEEARTSLHVGAHYNIVSLRYVCENNTPGAPQNQFLLFYDLVDGATLTSHLLNNRRNWMGMNHTLEDVHRHLFSLSYQLISGLEWLHSRQVLHFDIKPDNMLVDASGTRLQIADFGLARICQDRDDDDQPVHEFPGGTPAYRSPEIAAIQTHNTGSTVVGPKCSDLWAAALTILQVYACGSCPWYVHAPKASPGEHGPEGMSRYQSSKKDVLFTASSWQEVFGRRKSFVETMVSIVAPTDSVPEQLQHLPIREVLGFMVHDQHDSFRSDMGLRKGDVMKLRRLGHEVAVFSMPLALENLIADALSRTIDSRPDSIQEWKSRLAQAVKDDGQGVPSWQRSVIEEIDSQEVELVSDRDMAISFSNVGLALHQIDQHKTARSSYLKAIELAPSLVNPSALYNLATSCYAIGESAETRKYLHQLLELDPTYARAYYTLSKFARDERNLPAMAQYLQQCIEHDTANKLWKAHWKYGRVQRLLEGPAAAIACYQSCISRFAHCPNTHAYLALELFLARRQDEALKYARTAVDMDHKNAVGSYVIAHILLVRREEKDARQMFQRLEQRFGHAVHYSMGDLYWAYGAGKHAVDAYTFASAFDPDNAVLSNRVQELLSGISHHPTVEQTVDWVMSQPHKNLLV